MLFSEPKIPQTGHRRRQRSYHLRFQCSSASRKFLKVVTALTVVTPRAVSVLFSEPKIPQTMSPTITNASATRFSALQRAENSSNVFQRRPAPAVHAFQCSSASRKFLKSSSKIRRGDPANVSVLFSEPKIPPSCAGGAPARGRQSFQCSSASRKFLKKIVVDEAGLVRNLGFSALQRAENSSNVPEPADRGVHHPFQCSSASRKFLK